MKKKPLSHLELPNMLAAPNEGPSLPLKRPQDLQCEFFKRFLVQAIQNNELRKNSTKKD
jgi:hypothetical protein